MATQGHPTDIVFLSAVRTPFGAFGGTLRSSAPRIWAHAAKAALERAGV
jgi:acetyl-CoA C-acetyltransferase